MSITLTIHADDVDKIADALADSLHSLVAAGVIDDTDDNGWRYSLGTETRVTELEAALSKADDRGDELQERVALLEEAVERMERPIHIQCDENVHRTVVSAMQGRIDDMEVSLVRAREAMADARAERNVLRSLGKVVADAWCVPGVAPAYHDMMKAKLRSEWPVLYAAVQSLAAEIER